MSKNRSPCELAAEIAAALMWGPKSRVEIGEIVGFTSDKTNPLNKYLKQFRESGCIYVHGFTALGREIFCWQPTPFELPDAVKEQKTRRVKGAIRANAVTVTVGGVAMSVDEAAKRLGMSRRVVAYRHSKKQPIETGKLKKCQTSQA